MYLVQEEYFVLMRVLILHILVARHTDLFTFERGMVVLFISHRDMPKTQEQEAQLSFYVKIYIRGFLLKGVGSHGDCIDLCRSACVSPSFSSDFLAVFPSL